MQIVLQVRNTHIRLLSIDLECAVTYTAFVDAWQNVGQVLRAWTELRDVGLVLLLFRCLIFEIDPTGWLRAVLLLYCVALGRNGPRHERLADEG